MGIERNILWGLRFGGGCIEYDFHNSKSFISGGLICSHPLKYAPDWNEWCLDKVWWAKEKDYRRKYIEAQKSK